MLTSPRFCDACGAALAPTRRAHARHCGPSCRARASHERLTYFARIGRAAVAAA